MEGSWLADDADRTRMREMGGRIKPVRTALFALQAVALVACGPWLGWWPLLPLLIAACGFLVSDRLVDRLERPEWAIAGAWTLAEVMIAASIGLTGGPRSPVLAWLAVPVVSLASRFSRRGLVAGVGLAVGLLVASTLGVDPQRTLDAPQFVIATAVVIVGAGLLSSALLRSDLEHRSRAVVDPLTGLLNRAALMPRVHDLAQQSAVTGLPIAVIAGDLDHFKHVNDEAGHLVGDAALKDVAYRLRKALRAFDSAFRLGGEEFLVLVPGADVGHAAELAERVRAAVASAPIVGRDVTMSLGVAASIPGAPFRFDEVRADADAALYEAKRAGRNRVCGQRAPVLV